jgi:CheY-like chemotaxis protein
MDQSGTRMPGATSRTSARVLIADDSPSLRTVVRVTIESQGWTILEATNGTEALALARAQLPDLLLLDLDFADDGLEGLEVLTALRADPATAAMPVVVLTASSDPAHEARANAIGVALFLNKPFGPIDLIAALRRVLGFEVPGAPLGLHLVQTGAITPGQLQRALEEQGSRDAPVPLGQLLVERRAISEPELARALASQRERAAAAALRGRVLVVDDNQVVREGLRALIGAERRFDVVGDAGSATDAIALARTKEPDLVVLDHEMPGRTGLDAIADLRAAAPAAHIVMYTMSPNIGPKAAARGASAVVPKGDEALLLATLRRLADTQPERVAPPLGAPDTGPRARLTRASRRRPWRQVGGVAIAVAAYAVGFLIVEPAVGASAAVLSVVTVAAAGAALGPELGVVTAIATYAATEVLWSVTGHQPGEAILQIGGNGLGAIALLFLGAGVGAMRLVLSRSRRAEALLGHALIGRLDPAAAVDMARVVLDAQAAVLFRVSADRSELRSVAAAGFDAPPLLALDALADAARALREMQPAIVDDAARLAAVGARSAALVPLHTGVAGLGLLVLLDARDGRFGRTEPRVLEALGIAAARALDAAGSQPVIEAATATR